MTHIRTSILGLVSLLAVLAAGGRDAFAFGGTATGTIQHFNRMGNYCPSNRDCTGAKYPWSEFNVYRPVRHVKVYVRDQNTNIIGQGSTSPSGTFSVSWYSPTMPTSIHFTWHAEHKDNRFTLYAADGTSWSFWSGTRLPANGGTTAFGTWTWGSSTAPHDLTNWYDGAHRMWWDSLIWSTRHTALFNNVAVYTASTKCETSCADSVANQIYMNPNSAYAPHERIMHEMGHIASARGHEGGDYWKMSDYCWPGTAGCTDTAAGWQMDSPEWWQDAMEEATASTYATFGLYYGSAVAPHDCYASQAACATNTFNLETSTGTACAANENRRMITLARTFWDLHDSRADSVSGYTDNMSTSIENMVQAFTRFPDGRADRQKNEGWACFLFEEQWACWPENRDARNMDDYRQHYSEQTGVSGTAALRMNCL